MLFSSLLTVPVYIKVNTPLSSTALPEKHPPFSSLSYDSLGAKAMGICLQLTKSLLTACPQCIDDHSPLYGLC